LPTESRVMDPPYVWSPESKVKCAGAGVTRLGMREGHTSGVSLECGQVAARRSWPFRSASLAEVGGWQNRKSGLTRPHIGPSIWSALTAVERTGTKRVAGEVGSWRFL
jgi:hypothetical protein